MIMVVNDDLEEQNQCNGIKHSIELNIDHAALNLARVRDKENIQNGRVIPVWDFYGEIHNFYDGKEAEKLLSALGLYDMVLVDKLPVYYAVNNIVFEDKAAAEAYEAPIMGTGYEFSFLRGINGVPIETCGYRGASIPEDTVYNGYWAYESIKIGVDEKGIVSFRWVSPYTDISVDRSDVEFLPFENIENIFSKMIMVVNDNLEEQNRYNGIKHSIEIDIDCAALNLARVRDKEYIQNGRVIPVWDFYGEIHNFYDGKEAEPEYGVVLTIDAETGNIIDRQTGI